MMTGKMAPEGRQWAAARRGAAEDGAGGLRCRDNVGDCGGDCGGREDLVVTG